MYRLMSYVNYRNYRLIIHVLDMIGADDMAMTLSLIVIKQIVSSNIWKHT